MANSEDIFTGTRPEAFVRGMRQLAQDFIRHQEEDSDESYRALRAQSDAVLYLTVERPDPSVSEELIGLASDLLDAFQP